MRLSNFFLFSWSHIDSCLLFISPNIGLIQILCNATCYKNEKLNSRVWCVLLFFCVISDAQNFRKMSSLLTPAVLHVSDEKGISVGVPIFCSRANTGGWRRVSRPPPKIFQVFIPLKDMVFFLNVYFMSVHTFPL